MSKRKEKKKEQEKDLKNRESFPLCSFKGMQYFQ